MEDQFVEWKSLWKDDYLKHLSAFANSGGGQLHIGISDSGEILGIKDSKKLLEVLPNKIVDSLGINARVQRVGVAGGEYIKVTVDPSELPVDYKGAYYTRIGSTVRMLTGDALRSFLKKSFNIIWDEEILRNLNFEDLDEKSFEIFRRKAMENLRMPESEINMNNFDLLNKLHLVEAGRFKKAVGLLFYKDPARFGTGCYVKIAKFERGKLLYQDTLEKSFIDTADRIVELIYTKYLRAHVTFDKETRVETYPYPRPAVREAVYNALVHSDWRRGNPIQIRVEDETLRIINSCDLPQGWKAESLRGFHKSVLINPNIANVFYRAGYIEGWGLGIPKIWDECEAAGCPQPGFELADRNLMVVFYANPVTINGYSGDLALFSELSEIEINIINAIKNSPEITQANIAKTINAGLSSVKYYMKKLRDAGYITRTGTAQRGRWLFIPRK